MKKLAVLGKNNIYYTIIVWDLEENKLVTCRVSEDLDELTRLVQKDWLVSFENNDSLFVRDVVVRVDDGNILKTNNMFDRRIVGCCMSANIKSYGYNVEIVDVIKETSNILQYLLMKNKGL